MKRVYRILLGAVCLLGLALLSSCSGGGATVEPSKVEIQPSYKVGEVELSMEKAGPLAYTMYSLRDGRLVKGATSARMAILDEYGISRTPVSQALWKEVMGSNPSSVQGDDLPVDRVSYDEVQKFLMKLRRKTGVPFVVPTEAMLEAALRRETIKEDKDLREWTSDGWSDAPAISLVRNPATEVQKSLVVRTATSREEVPSYTKAGGLVFRLALLGNGTYPEQNEALLRGESTGREHVCSNEKIQVGNLTIEMMPVKGGTLTMGATAEQGDYAADNEKPSHDVQVEDFELARTEVTVGLFAAVMGYLPYGNNIREATKPVVNVSWYTAQEFILALRERTGRLFRLPTEQEWEWAARGGVKTHNCRFSGSNNVDAVAIYTRSGNPLKVYPVGTCVPNELGLYDMSGNAWEWTASSFSDYATGAVEDPEWKVMRGGSAASPWNACRVSNRSKIPASNLKSTFGFRLAL